MGRVSGKTVIVTGGARGLGAAIVSSLVAEGARVVVADLLEPEGRALVERLGGQARFLKLDVTDEQAWQRAVAFAEEEFGPVNALVNNAGIVHEESMETLSEANYRKVIDVNQVAVFLGMKSVVPSMKKAGGGSIVNISSIGGIIAFSGIMGYVASKWAVRGMTKAAAQELGPLGIRVNSVHPGFVTTEMTEGTGVDQMAAIQPLRRTGRPDELAALVLFLVSDESSYSTGSEFVADGGFTSM
ncbi:glucose 1-dehydrogenase [Bailinhaonella thermotolerans]|uniref:Glucose 1-dehydrogenase n=1 Tax=Bailinhaonella thermotolerans TaxID=1070861 RepID=A0A3A4AQ46_9ACTN|nr:glucose 1-dehydrogenase [Bailinhaonella thermotolerans]RJL30535.1 glucose 1-dehydrogenase [Bailinhaonella thermotolerans]